MIRLDSSAYIEDVFTPELIDLAHETSASFDMSQLHTWVLDRTKTYELKGQRFRMVVDEGEEPDKALVIGGEFANGTDSIGSIARAILIREMVLPTASIILQPNSTISENNTNFSKDERHKLRLGRLSPIVDRVKTTLEANGNPSEITAYGPSQGASVVLGLAAQDSVPVKATAIMEAPALYDRSYFGLIRDFSGAGSDLKQNILDNFDVGGNLGEQLADQLTLLDLVKYGLGAVLTPDNVALAGMMRWGKTIAGIRKALHNGSSVVQAYSTGDNVSPASYNAMIADRLEGSHYYGNKYEPAKFEGDHSITNNYLLNAAIVQRAQILA